MTKSKFILIAALGFSLFSFGRLFGQDQTDKENWNEFSEKMAEFGDRMAEFGEELSVQIQEAVADIDVNIDMNEINEALENVQVKLNHVQMNMNDVGNDMNEHGTWVQSEINKSFTVSKGGRLSVNLVSGDINISTWDKDEVNITASFFDEEEMEGLKISQTDNTVTVEHRSSWGSTADLEIKIPSNFNLDLNTTSGDIIISGALTGSLTAQTMGGDIGADNITGKIEINTSGGDIHAGDINGENSFNTMGGDITVGNVSGAELKIQTMGGDITVESVASGITAKTYGGDIRVKSVKGDCSTLTYGGDIHIETLAGDGNLDTKGGDIIVEKAAGKITAKTAGGDISFEYLEGSLKAKTASGSIYAALIPAAGSDNYINASHGDITVAFPDNAKATVNVSIRLRGWNFDDEDSETGITSDFQEVSANSNNNNKDIKKTYSINGGGAAVNIEATNSDVKVVKYTGQRVRRDRDDE